MVCWSLQGDHKTQDSRPKTQDLRLKTQDLRLRTQGVSPLSQRGARGDLTRHSSLVTRHLSCVLCLAFCVLCLFPSSSEGAFRDNFLGARSVAMGGAYTALADDADGALVNPAGLSNIEGQQIIAALSALHVGLSDDSFVSQNILGYAYRQRRAGTLGIIWKRLAASDLYFENVLALSFARDFVLYLKKSEEDRGKNLFLGATLNLMSWDSAPTIGADGKVIEDLPGWRGLGFDVGLTVWPSENIPVALALQNINRPDIASNVSEVEERLPIATRMGVAAIGEDITWAMDMILRDGQIDLRTGLEKRYGQNFAIRGGFSLENLAWGTNFTLGAGYKPGESTRIDYAFVYPVNTILSTLGSHRISVVYDFGQ